jgi:hypothetical protein
MKDSKKRFEPVSGMLSALQRLKGNVPACGGFVIDHYLLSPAKNFQKSWFKKRGIGRGGREYGVSTA